MMGFSDAPENGYHVSFTLTGEISWGYNPFPLHRPRSVTNITNMDSGSNHTVLRSPRRSSSCVAAEAERELCLSCPRPAAEQSSVQQTHEHSQHYNPWKEFNGKAMASSHDRKLVSVDAAITCEVNSCVSLTYGQSKAHTYHGEAQQCNPWKGIFEPASSSNSAQNYVREEARSNSIQLVSPAVIDKRREPRSDELLGIAGSRGGLSKKQEDHRNLKQPHQWKPYPSSAASFGSVDSSAIVENRDRSCQRIHLPADQRRWKPLVALPVSWPYRLDF